MDRRGAPSEPGRVVNRTWRSRLVLVLLGALLLSAATGCGSSKEVGTGTTGCQAQDQNLQWAVNQSGASAKNTILAVRNPSCGTSVYISGGSTTATSSSLWRIASVTKTFVSASVLALVKEGKVSLDDPLSKWVPNVPRTDGVTVTMLLDHRSGIFDYLEDPAFKVNAPCTPQQIVDSPRRTRHISRRMRTSTTRIPTTSCSG